MIVIKNHNSQSFSLDTGDRSNVPKRDAMGALFELHMAIFLPFRDDSGQGTFVPGHPLHGTEKRGMAFSLRRIQRKSKSNRLLSH